MMAVHEMQQGITLSDLLTDIVDAAVLQSCGSLPITSLALDSRSVEQGALFIAVKGEQTHGMDFASEAVAKGAVAVVYELVLHGQAAGAHRCSLTFVQRTDLVGPRGGDIQGVLLLGTLHAQLVVQVYGDDIAVFFNRFGFRHLDDR